MKFLVTGSLNKEEIKNLEKQGLYCYQLRDNEMSKGIATIEKNVKVNNIGSMITNEEIKFDNNKYPLEYKDYVEFIAKNEPVNTIKELLDSNNRNMQKNKKGRER